MFAAGTPLSTAPPLPLSATALRPIVRAAIDRWAAAGLDADQIALMRRATFTITDLGGLNLGAADRFRNSIQIDDDAAGFGWFVDPTPENDSEFVLPGDQGEMNRMDLLSVVAHELGHLIGLDHDPDNSNVMGETLATGTRRLPSGSDPLELQGVEFWTFRAGFVPSTAITASDNSGNADAVDYLKFRHRYLLGDV